MATNRTKQATHSRVNFLTGFVPLRDLWAGDNALYPSETSARWARRKLETELADARAVALVRGDIMVHPQRWAEVAERDAIGSFQNRVAAKTHNQDSGR